MKNRYCWVVLIFLYSFSLNLLAGSKNGSGLKNIHTPMMNYLIEMKICNNYRSCSDVLQVSATESDDVVISIYGQRDRKIAATVAGFLIERGFDLAKKPISLKIYSSDKNEHQGIFGMLNSSDVIASVRINR